jgi:hypothetical protein
MSHPNTVGLLATPGQIAGGLNADPVRTAKLEPMVAMARI